MPRTKNNVASRKRRKKILKLAKGAFGARSKVYTIAKTGVEKGLQHAYRDRKLKKRTFRSLWIIRINAAVRKHDINYSKFIYELNEKGIKMNRKMLASIATENPAVFDEIVKFAIN